MTPEMFKKYMIFMAVALLIVSFSGCSKSDDVAAKAPAYASAITETMLLALNTSDYGSYILAVDADMFSRNTQKTFTDYAEFVQKRIGSYKSKKVSEVKVEGERTTVIYTAKYSKEPAGVTVTIIFNGSGESVSVVDLWLNSPKLWEN
jgi:hypothetical protein